jgi:hypothetical protein
LRSPAAGDKCFRRWGAIEASATGGHCNSARHRDLGDDGRADHPIVALRETSVLFGAASLSSAQGAAARVVSAPRC